MSYISILDNIDDHVEYSEYSECTVYATVILMLIYMGVVLKPMQEFKYVSDICRYVRVFLLQWRKAAKAWRKVREGSEYHYLYEVCTRKHDHNSVS